MTYLIVIFLGLIVISLTVGLWSLFTGDSQRLKKSLTVRIALSVGLFVLFLLYYAYHQFWLS